MTESQIYNRQKHFNISLVTLSRSKTAIGSPTQGIQESSLPHHTWQHHWLCSRSYQHWMQLSLTPLPGHHQQQPRSQGCPGPNRTVHWPVTSVDCWPPGRRASWGERWHWSHPDWCWGWHSDCLARTAEGCRWGERNEFLSINKLAKIN